MNRRTEKIDAWIVDANKYKGRVQSSIISTLLCNYSGWPGYEAETDRDQDREKKKCV